MMFHTPANGKVSKSSGQEESAQSIDIEVEERDLPGLKLFAYINGLSG